MGVSRTRVAIGRKRAGCEVVGLPLNERIDRFARTSPSLERRKHQEVCIALTRGKDDHIRCAIDAASARNSHEFDRLLLLYLGVVNSQQGSIRCQLGEIYIWRVDQRLGFRRKLVVILNFLKASRSGPLAMVSTNPD
jgi:hypothetical protein